MKTKVLWIAAMIVLQGSAYAAQLNVPPLERAVIDYSSETRMESERPDLSVSLSIEQTKQSEPLPASPLSKPSQLDRMVSDYQNSRAFLASA